MMQCPRVSLFVLAALGSADAVRAQDEVKIPRPVPIVHDDKVSSDIQSPTLPPTPWRPAVPASRNKPKPSGAPDVENIPFAFERVLFSEPGDGRIWARGADYKASFGADGAVFVPFLGSDAPQNFPVALELASVRVAGQPMEFAEHGSVNRTGDTIAIDRGDVDEVYDLAAKSMEQTIVIERLPALGDLHIELAIETELEARQVGTGIEFENDLGGVRYGSVTVIDANGARYETASLLVDDRIVIDVPAAFVTTARLPLRVDPILSSFTVATSIVDDYYADIAFDLTTNRWCAIYEHVYSTTDHDVRSVLFDSVGVVLGGSQEAIDTTSDSWARPCIANNNLADNFLVVANVSPVGGGASLIKAATRAAGSGLVGAQNVISGPEVGTKFWADVGGDPHTSGPTYYFVVYQRDLSTTDTDIHGRLVNSNGTPQGPTIFVDNSGPSVDFEPRVSNSDGAPPATTQDWNVVWVRYDSVNFDYDIRGAQIHWDGGITTASFPIDSSFANDTQPVASSPLDRAVGPRPWLVVYRHLSGSTHDLYGQVLVNGVSWVSSNLTLLEGIAPAEDQISPDVDSDGSQFCVSFAESYLGSNTDYDIYTSTFAYADGALVVCEGHVNLDFLAEYSFSPRIASAHSSGQSSNLFATTWTNVNGLFYIRAGLHTAPDEVPVYTFCAGDGMLFNCPCSFNGQVGHGCGNSSLSTGALLAGSGSRLVSSDSFVMTVSDVPAVAPCLFFQGTSSTVSPFGDGILCVGGSIVRLGVKFASGGTANYPGVGDPQVSVTGLLGTNGANRYYQAWYRDAAPFCTAGTYNLTNGIRVLWLP